MDDLKNMFYDSDAQNNIDYSRDFEKFTDIGSPRSNGSSQTSKLSLRDLLNESFDDYLSKLKQV